MPRPVFYYRSRPQTDVQPGGVGRRKFPHDKEALDYLKAYAFDVEFECVLDAVFPPVARNTPSTAAALNTVAGYAQSDANAILTDYSQPSDSGAGMGKFSATFNIVPAKWDKYVDQTVTFPGIRDVNYTGGVRDPKSFTVKTRQRRDFFLVDPDNLAAGVKDSGGADIVRVNSKGSIPSLLRTPFGFTTDGGATMLTTSEVTGLVKAGGIPGWFETVPKTETYQAWIGVVAAFNAALPGGPAWDDTHPPVWDGAVAPPATIGQWRFADSRLEAYAGNIFCRVSEHVLAQ